MYWEVMMNTARLIAAAAVAWGVFASGGVRAGPGDCTALSAPVIDTCFVDWALANGFASLAGMATKCVDDPKKVDISLYAVGPNGAVFLVWVLGAHAMLRVLPVRGPHHWC